MIEAYVLEERHHLIVCCVVRNKEANIGIVEDRSNADQASSTTGHNSDILPGVLTVLTLAMHLIVHSSDGSAEGLDTGRRAILSSGNRDVDMSRSRERAFNFIIDLRGTLA